MSTPTAATVALILRFASHHPGVGMQIDATGGPETYWQIGVNTAIYNEEGIQLAGANDVSTHIVVIPGDSTSTQYNSYFQYNHAGGAIVSHVHHDGSAQFLSVKGGDFFILVRLTTTSGTSNNLNRNRNDCQWTLLSLPRPRARQPTSQQPIFRPRLRIRLL